MTQVIVPPNIDDTNLLFDDQETRDILTFLWPNLSPTIGPMTVTTEIRRFAQSLLIAAIDASYALGFVEILFRSVANPRGGLKSMGKKLAKRFVQHWWKHVRPQDLEDVKIYESVRATVSNNFGRVFRLMLIENTARVQPMPFMWAARRSSQTWV